MKDNDVFFADEAPKLNATSFGEKESWKVLIADDEPQVHEMTKIILEGIEFHGQKIEFISSYSEKETRDVLKNNPDIAAILLDVVMENEHSGLDIVKYIRTNLNNQLIRIILRTGQPGQAPEHKIIKEYDINDYREKTELTAQKLLTVVYSALRSYNDLLSIQNTKRGLEEIIGAANELFRQQSVTTFAQGVLKQLAALMHVRAEGFIAINQNQRFNIIAGIGKFQIRTPSETAFKEPEARIMEKFLEAKNQKSSFFTDNEFIGYYQTEKLVENFIYLTGVKDLNEIDKNLLKIFSTNISIAFDNIYLLKNMRYAQQELSKAQNYLLNVFNSLESILFSTNGDGSVNQWNNLAENFIFPKEKNTKAPFWKFIPEFAPFKSDFLEVIKTKKSKTLYSQTLENHKDKFFNIFFFPIIANNLDNTESIEGTVVRIDDVTDRINFERMIIQTEKMMSVGGLAAGMAHEINNPLGIVIQGIQNISRRFSADLPRNLSVASEVDIDLNKLDAYMQKRGITEIINGVREAGIRAANIIENMLNFSRSSETSRHQHKLPEIIEKTIQLASNDYSLKKQFDFRQIKIIRNFSEEIESISCISNEIEQVLLNFLKNAAQSVRYKKYPEGEHPEILIRTERENNWALISVRDNGTGIKKEDLKHIFNPFFTTKPVGVGTGLGLSVSYFIITENHQGKLDVKSAPGEFAEFIVRLPLEQTKN